MASAADIAQLLRAAVQGTAGDIYGGYRGLAALPQGMDAAAQAVQQGQQSLAYTPTAPGAQRLAAGLRALPGRAYAALPAPAQQAIQGAQGAWEQFSGAHPAAAALTAGVAGAGIPGLDEGEGAWRAIAHAADETGEHTFSSARGVLRAQETDLPTGPALQVKRADAEGGGAGTALYKAAAEHAAANGLHLASDTSVSPSAQRRWVGGQRSLEAQGYEVRQNPLASINPDTGNLVSHDPRAPVFTIAPPTQ